MCEVKKDTFLEINETACLICHSRDKKIVFSYQEPDQYEVAAGISKDGYYRRWVNCTGCGFYYSLYSRNSAVLDRLYTSAYRDKQSLWRQGSAEEVFERVVGLPKEESETKFRVEWIKKRINHAWNSGLVKREVPPYRLLDIGGATGVFSYEFQDKDWRSCVIDSDENGMFIESKLNVPFLQRKYAPNSFGFPFHLISMIFVLEHITDPVGLLQDLHYDMGPNSFLYIEVPDEASFKFKPPEDDIFNSCHLWMFGPHTLLLLLGSCGFEVMALNRTKTKRGHYSLMVLAGEMSENPREKAKRRF